MAGAYALSPVAVAGVRRLGRGYRRAVTVHGMIRRIGRRGEENGW